MKFGVCYYPEHWPEDRWAEDARLMRGLGLDIIRLAEFAWAKMEPQGGRVQLGMAGSGYRPFCRGQGWR